MLLDLRSYMAGDFHTSEGDGPLEENEVVERDNVLKTSPVLQTLSRDNTEYRLYAVVNHIGGMGSGHYTAYVRGDGERWLCCNDSQVYPISEEAVVSANAYLLFYERLDTTMQVPATPSRSAIMP